MFNNIFKKKDPVADMIAQIAEADYKAKMEELKGQQHKIDKNKNNKIDAHDFAILRGEKKAMKKEETEQVDEVNNPFDLKNYKSQLKTKPGEKAGFDSKKISTGTVYSRKPVKDEPMKKEEVEQVDEVYDVEHMKYINTKEGDKHFENGHATMMKHIGDEFQKVNAKRYAHNAFKENPHEKGTKEYKAWHHGADAARDEHIGGLHEAAKWRSTSIAKKVTDPDDYHDSASYDYHHDNPRSTGMKKATSDTPTKYSSLSARPSVQVASQGARKGMITKQHAERLKARIKAGMNNEEVEQIDELKTSTLLRYQTKANKALIGGDRNKEEKRIKGIQKANYKIQSRYAKEEVEQIDELKKETLKNYVSKATDSARTMPGYGTNAEKNKKTIRHAGISKATEKLAKEEVEQVDELSKKTLASYADKAMQHMKDKKEKLGDRPGTPADWKRIRGIYTAKSKMNEPRNEEVEQVDERTLTKGETKEKERIVKGMKKSLAGFKQRYGERAKSVMYATATKAAKKD